MDSLLHTEKLLNQRLLAELDRVTRGKHSLDKPSKVEHMLKTTKCLISFQGWTNLNAVRSVRALKSVNTTTEIKNLETRIF
jgi:hypothetical protein